MRNLPFAILPEDFSMMIEEASGWYWLDGEFYIISDFPGAAARRKEHPEIPALPLAELDRRAVGPGKAVEVSTQALKDWLAAQPKPTPHKK